MPPADKLQRSRRLQCELDFLSEPFGVTLARGSLHASLFFFFFFFQGVYESHSCFEEKSLSRQKVHF